MSSVQKLCLYLFSVSFRPDNTANIFSLIQCEGLQPSASKYLILRLRIPLSGLQKSHLHWRSPLQSGADHAAQEAGHTPKSQIKFYYSHHRSEKKSEDIRESNAAERDATEQVLTSRPRNKARPRRTRRSRGATSSTWWWTSCCCDRRGPTQAREEGKAQNQSEETEGGKKKKVTSERSY